MTNPPEIPGPQTPGEGLPEIVPDQRWAPRPTPAPPPERRQSAEPLISFLGDVVRTGRWEVPRTTTVYGLTGNIKLDLREVLEPGEVLEINGWMMMGDVRVLVPPGTHVEVRGTTLMGDGRIETDAATQGAAPTGARVVLSVNSLMGNVRVRTMALDAKPPMGWRWARSRP